LFFEIEYSDGSTQTVVTEVRNVPNEPLLFAGESEDRTEDGIIAYAWDKFLRTGDDKWPARLPMTKSAVRAMERVEGRAPILAFGSTLARAWGDPRSARPVRWPLSLRVGRVS